MAARRSCSALLAVMVLAVGLWPEPLVDADACLVDNLLQHIQQIKLVIAAGI